VRYLLDTVALSEWSKPSPNAAYVDWSKAQATDDTFIGAPSIGELAQGIAPLPRSRKRILLQHWLQNILAEFEARILPLDATAASTWGIASARARRRGRSLPIIDSQLGAIAIVNGLTVVTRNVHDFDIPEFQEQGLKIISPWI
jgi:toxin FitB